MKDALQIDHDSAAPPDVHRIGVLAASLLLGALLLIPATSAPAAEITDANVAQHIEAATTAAEHEALAAYYRAQAALQAERVELHEDMLERYARRGGKPYQNMKGHCQRAVNTSRELQKEYEALAAEHEQLAKEAGAGS